MREVAPALSVNSSQFINNARQQQHKTNISHQQLHRFMTCLIGKLIEAYTQPERLNYHLEKCVFVLPLRSGSVWMPGANLQEIFIINKIEYISLRENLHISDINQ